MNPSPSSHIDEVRKIVHAVLGNKVSDVFLGRVDAVLADWAAGKIGAAQACEKVQKMVALFIDEGKARDISSRCAPIVMRETASPKK